MSDYEVTLVNDNMQEFYVRFKGPDESTSSLPLPADDLFQADNVQRPSPAASGKSTSKSPTNTLTNPLPSAS